MKLITDYISDLFTQELTSQEAFDDWHKRVCVEICEVSNKYIDCMENGYSYGLAEKILNMTLRNMFDTGKWSVQLERVEKYINV
jgi:dimeric dUTPase (all-alpha-NTP-PPase superfamily)